MKSVNGTEARVLVWKRGHNDSDHGPLIWNERAIAEVMGTYRKRGNLILLDINHNYNEEERAKWEARGEPAPTAGYASLELGSDGSLWMVPQWSEYALSKIKGRELRYISPDFSYDKKTRELLDIYRISLVAEPGTWGARLVASAKRKGRLSMIGADAIAALMELSKTMQAEGVSDNLQAKVQEIVAMFVADAPAAPENALEQAEKDKAPAAPLPAAATSSYTLQADTYARQRRDLEARNLCSALRDQARRELNTKPIEEQELAKYNRPEELERAIGLLRASRGGNPPPTPHREETRREPEAPAPKGPYTATLAQRGLLNGGAR